MALMALLAVVVMAFAYVLVSRLNAASQFVAIDREHNAKALNQAKQALIGWMAINAAGTDPNPGRLPCPEAPADFNTANEGRAAPNCTLPAVGRLPWRTLGLEKLVDANAEPLWYVVSPGWALPSSTSTLTINSESQGQLSVDGAANDAVALVIAPGPAIAMQACGGSAALVQTRPTSAPPNLRNYLECDNATSPADATFVTASAGNTFNDQVLPVRAADLIPALEAAVADRMQREIAPALRGVYASAPWGTSSTNPMYPFATPFADPGVSNNYQGDDGRYQGLLPFTCSATGCAPDARYSTTFVRWNDHPANKPTISIDGAISDSWACNFPDPSTVRCTGTYMALGTVTLRMSVRALNVAMALRQFDTSKITIEYGFGSCTTSAPGSSTASAVFQPSGQAELTLQGTSPGLVGPPPLTVSFCMTADIGLLSDHPLLDKDHAITGWFVRNEWYRLVYYAAAKENTADWSAAQDCATGTNCLQFNNTRNIRVLLVLAGRRLDTQNRSTAAERNKPLNYVEYENGDLDTIYEQRPIRMSRVPMSPINAPSNDRVVLVDWDTPPVVPSQAVLLAPLRIATLP
jgi:hypothetical protein